LKIAILGTRGIPAQYGGFETFAEKLSIGLVKRGFEVTVFCEANGLDAAAEYSGVKLLYCRAPKLGSLQTVLFDLQCLWCSRKNYDLVYMLGYGCAPGCLIPRLWSTKVWINPDGLEWARAKWGTWARLYFRLMEWVSVRVPNRLIPDSAAVASILGERHGRLPPYDVIPYGCEITEQPPSIDFLTDLNLTPLGYYLVVCRFEPENHVLEILKAFQQSNSKRELVLIGDYHSGTVYTKHLLGVRDPRIRFIGTVYNSEKLKALRYHSFGYLHGHSVGGTNPSLLEAMGCGNLIFAHDNLFNRETLGSFGRFFGTEQELTAAINRAEAQDASAQARLRAGALERARDVYDWETIIDQYATVIRETSVSESESTRSPRPTESVGAASWPER
jgi:glycosyltransferase involved in cell wall biosynthesis